MASSASQDRSAPGRLVLPTLCLASFVSMVNLTAPAPFFPAISRELGVSVALLGQILAAMLILGAVLGLVIGPLADRSGTRRFIVIGLLATALALADYGLAPVFWVLLFASIAGAIGEATVPGLTMAVAGSQFHGSAARRALSLTASATTSARIVGIPVMALIGEAIGWRAAFLAAAALTATVALMASISLPKDTTTATDTPRPGAILDAYRPIARDRSMRLLFGSTLLRSLCWIGMLTYFGALLESAHGLSTGEIGLAYMLSGIAYFSGSLAAGGPLSRVPSRLLVVVGNTVMSLLLLAVFTSALGLAATVALYTIASFAASIGWVALAHLLSSETPAGVGTTMVLNISLFNVGAASGAAVGGILLAAGGFDAIALVLPLFGLVSAALAWMPTPRATLPAPVTAD